jgi:hypothetical protein
MMKMRNYRRR